jgi:hypothetical protein
MWNKEDVVKRGDGSVLCFGATLSRSRPGGFEIGDPTLALRPLHHLQHQPGHGIALSTELP